MQVRVLFFGVLKDLAGRSSDTLSLAENARAADVISHYQQHLSANKQIFKSIAISVNQEYAAPEMKLHAGDEIALLPPVSGGAGESNPQNVSVGIEARALLTHVAIDTSAAIAAIKRPEDGAAIIFEGIVRNNTRGRRTLFLDYEAYEEMAVKEMESLIASALDKFPVRDALIIHRLGRIEIGEISVLIVVASAHRAAAFEACRWLIDTLKRTVPIWKKEQFEDGAVWSDGEPFPDSIIPSALDTQPTAPQGSQSKNSASNSIAHK